MVAAVWFRVPRMLTLLRAVVALLALLSSSHGVRAARAVVVSPPAQAPSTTVLVYPGIAAAATPVPSPPLSYAHPLSSGLGGPRVPLAPVAAPTTTTVAPVPAPYGVADLPEPWACMAVHESGSDPSINTGNNYYGMWQFAPATWDTMMAQMGLGYRDYPYAAAAPLSVQLAAAERLQAEAGWDQWPVSSRLCGV